MKIALVVLFLSNALVHLYACCFGMNTLRRLTKPLIMLLMIANYCLLASTVNVFVLLGMAFALIGDIFLMHADSGAYFMVGACAFAAGHACYITGLITGTAVSTLAFCSVWGTTALIAALFIAILAVVYIKLFPRLPGNKKVFLPIYMLLICVFGAIAGTAMVHLGGGGFIPMFVGALLFLISDSILSFRTFGDTGSRTSFYVMLTYISAQALIALGFILI